MNISEFRVGNLVKAGNTIGEVVTIDSNRYYFVVKNSSGSLNEYDRLTIEPIFIERTMLVNCFGFDKDGKLKISIDSRDFYFQENEGHIILLESNLWPLIHFWDLKTLHQLQNFYYRFKGEHLAYNVKNLEDCKSINLHTR